MKYYFALLSLIVISLISSNSFSSQCEVLGVIDGDTLTLSCPGFKGDVNVNGIDCPESGQSYWKEAKERLESALQNKKVSFELNSKKTIVTIILSDGKNLSSVMVFDGLAWSMDRKSSQKNYLLEGC
jgi:endonuclease YncB( thermonuclease family)